MANYDKLGQQIAAWQRMVEEEGGKYIGVQSPFEFTPGEESEWTVIFTRPDTPQEIALPVSKMTQENIRAKMGKKVTSVRKVELDKVKATILRIAARIRAVADEIEEEIKNS